MDGRYLLDTSAAIRVLNQELDLEAHRGQGHQVFLSLTVVGELLFGAEKSERPAENRSRVQGLIERCPVVGQDLETAAHYGTTKARLRRKGRPIPENDIWIAAAALRYALTLVTGDDHFEAVDGLAIARW